MLRFLSCLYDLALVCLYKDLFVAFMLRLLKDCFFAFDNLIYRGMEGFILLMYFYALASEEVFLFLLFLPKKSVIFLPCIIFFL